MKIQQNKIRMKSKIIALGISESNIYFCAKKRINPGQLLEPQKYFDKLSFCIEKTYKRLST